MGRPPDPDKARCKSFRTSDPWLVPDPVGNAVAREICKTCPERQTCLAYAESTQACWGIWGGESFHPFFTEEYHRGRKAPPPGE